MPYGTLIYNGYQFGSFTHTTVQAAIAYGDDGRTRTGTRYVLTATQVITAEPGDPADTDAGDHFERVRALLTQPGARLQIDDIGFGPVDLNGPNNASPRDLDYGPKPRILSWEPIGHRWTVEFVWQVEFFVHDVCQPDIGNPADPPVVGFAYTISYSISRSGHTTRTVQGYLQIAAGRDTNNPNRPYEVVDEYRSLIVVLIPTSFRRERQDYTSNEAKNRLDFVIIDREIPSPVSFPADVIDIQATHLAQKSRRDMAVVYHTLDVSIEMAQDKPRLRAWEIFQNIYTQLLGSMNAGVVFFESLDISEEIFRNRFRFSSAFRVMQGGILSMVRDQGLFDVFLNYDWGVWAASLATNVTDPRGLAKLKNEADDDRLVDACNNELPTIGSSRTYPTIPPAPTAPTITNQTPSPDASYIHFEASLTEETEYKKSRAYELGAIEVQSTPFSASEQNGNLSPVNGLDNLEVVVADAAPNMLWRWRGYAERIGYPIGSPDLANVDGQVPLEKIGTDSFVHRNVGKVFGVDKYVASWDFLYLSRLRPSTHYQGNLNPNPDSDS